MLRYLCICVCLVSLAIYFGLKANVNSSQLKPLWEKVLNDQVMLQIIAIRACYIATYSIVIVWSILLLHVHASTCIYVFV